MQNIQKGLRKGIIIIMLVLITSVFSFNIDGTTKVANAINGNSNAYSQCLPEGVNIDDVVSTSMSGATIVKVTVGQKLKELKASCKNGKLVDKNGKEIVFYYLTGCWGTPPPDADAILQNQQNEINALSQQYTVIQMTCNPSGLPIQ